MLIVLLFILLLLPLTFQIIYGIKIIKGSSKMKLAIVSLSSFLGQLLVTLLTYYLMAYIIERSESRDGLPMVGVVLINIVLGIVLLLVILVQFIVRIRSSRS